MPRSRLRSFDPGLALRSFGYPTGSRRTSTPTRDQSSAIENEASTRLTIIMHYVNSRSSPPAASLTPRPKPKLPSALPLRQISQTQLRPVHPAALIQLLHGQIASLYVIPPALHVLGIVRGTRHDPTPSRRHPYAKLPRRRLVIRINKAPPRARPVRHVPHEFRPPVRIDPNGRNNPRTHRQQGNQPFGIVL